LVNIAINGCRILVINQLMFGKTNLCIETVNGEFKELSSMELKEIIEENNNKLNIDAVFINIPGGIEIAKVFRDLGVNQVFVYNKMFCETEILFSEFMRYATVEIIKKFIKEKTFYQAYTQTL
jgi:hypothetical protein